MWRQGKTESPCTLTSFPCQGSSLKLSRLFLQYSILLGAILRQLHGFNTQFLYYTKGYTLECASLISCDINLLKLSCLYGISSRSNHLQCTYLQCSVHLPQDLRNHAIPYIRFCDILLDLYSWIYGNFPPDYRALNPPILRLGGLSTSLTLCSCACRQVTPA